MLKKVISCMHVFMFLCRNVYSNISNIFKSLISTITDEKFIPIILIILIKLQHDMYSYYLVLPVSFYEFNISLFVSGVMTICSFLIVLIFVLNHKQGS